MYSFVHSINIYICCKALARLWGYDAEQDIICALMEQLFLAGEGSIQKLPHHFITTVVIFQLSVDRLWPDIYRAYKYLQLILSQIF